jgi:O-antigen/teichoic acid export membrane protein
VGVVLSGTVAAQAIPLLGSLVLARQYAPAQYGVFSAWLGMAYLAAVVLTGRFEMALGIVPDGEPRRLAVQATLATILLAAAAMAAVGIVALLVFPGLRADLTPAMVAAFVPTSLLIAAAQTWQLWAAADGRFRDLTILRVSQAAAITAPQIAAGFLAPTATTLALSHFCGVLVGVCVAAWRMPLGPLAAFRDHVPSFWRRHRGFPSFSLPADSVNTAAAQLPLLIVTSRFGAEAAGLLALTLRTLGAPIALLGASVLDVFRRRAATAFRERGECRAEYVETFRILSLASIVLSPIVVVLGEPLFAVVFGARWARAGAIAAWLVPMFALRFVASPLSYMVYVAGKQHVDLAWQVCLLGVTLATLWLPGGFDGAMKWYSAGYGSMYLVYLMLSYRFSLGTRR